MKFYAYLITAAGLLSSCQFSEKSVAQQVAPASPKIDSTRLSLLFVGDLMNHSPQTSAAYDIVSKQYIYDTCYYWVKDYLSKPDISIANLEVTLAGYPYTGYPMFSAPDAYAIAAKNAGFDYFFTSNNHTCDKKLKGVVRTLDVLDSLNIGHTGSFRNLEERNSTYPSIVEKNGIKLAFLNATYGTNGMPIPAPSMVNLLDSIQLKADFEKAKSLNPDFIIMGVHWGNEYQRTPSADQKKWADFFIRNGANLIIGSHPHVVQTFERRNGVPVIYSLGNFISNQRDRYKDGGIAYEIELLKTEGKTQIISHNYQAIWVQKQQYPKVVYRLIPEDFKADSLFNSTEKAAWKTFVNDTRNHFILDSL